MRAWTYCSDSSELNVQSPPFTTIQPSSLPTPTHHHPTRIPMPVHLTGAEHVWRTTRTRTTFCRLQAVHTADVLSRTVPQISDPHNHAPNTQYPDTVWNLNLMGPTVHNTAIADQTDSGSPRDTSFGISDKVDSICDNEVRRFNFRILVVALGVFTKPLMVKAYYAPACVHRRSGNLFRRSFVRTRAFGWRWLVQIGRHLLPGGVVIV